MADSISPAALAFSRSCEIREAKGGRRGSFDERKHPRDQLGRFAGAAGGFVRREIGNEVKYGPAGRIAAFIRINRLPADKRLEATERYISQAPREMLGMFRGNRLIGLVRGHGSSVGPTPLSFPSMLLAKTYTHNHPGAGKGENYAWLSTPDVRLNTPWFPGSPGGKTIRVVDRNGNWQSFKHAAHGGLRGRLGFNSAANLVNQAVSSAEGAQAVGVFSKDGMGDLVKMSLASTGGRVIQLAKPMIQSSVSNWAKEAAKQNAKTKPYAGAIGRIAAGAAWHATDRTYDRMVLDPLVSRVVKREYAARGTAGIRDAAGAYRRAAKRLAAERLQHAARTERARKRESLRRQAAALAAIGVGAEGASGKYNW